MLISFPSYSSINQEWLHLWLEVRTASSRNLPKAAVRIVSTKLSAEKKYLTEKGRAVGICHVRAVFERPLKIKGIDHRFPSVQRDLKTNVSGV